MQKIILSFLLVAINTSVQAQTIKFLEQKTAFCYSKQALTQYLTHAQHLNIEGMNKLVLKGHCEFVPDGEVIQLKHYKVKTIGDRKVIRFEMNNNTYWTPKALVKTADFGNL
ncbi:MAG: hypothetical protein PVJ39_19945 [Gammaproteobacteria bacterium]